MVDKGKIIRCRGCDTPLARVEGNKIHYIKFHNDKNVEITVEVRHTRGGVTVVECEKCRGRITPHQFITLVHPTHVQAVSKGVE